MIKIGKRHNLIYPLMLMIFIILRRIEVILMSKIFNYNWPFLLPVLIFLSKFTGGFIGMYYTQPEQSINKKKNKRVSFFGINAIPSPHTINIPDNYYKIGLLIFFASYFDYIGTFIRKFVIYTTYNKINVSDTLEHSVRSVQVLSSALFCYFTIGTTMYRHQRFSLIMIFINIISILIAELLSIKASYSLKNVSFFLACFSAISRALLDTIEKYLFEIDLMNPFKVMMFEGIINTIFSTSMFFLFDAPLKDIYNLKTKFPEWNIILILFLMVYSIISGFKNIYRVVTIKLYSPMTRALCESIFDPFLVMYYYLDNKYNKDPKYWVYFGIILLCTMIMDLCSCIYNEFIILYCWGLEYNTHIEITKRATCYESEIGSKEIDGNILEIEGEELLLDSDSFAKISSL